MRRACLCFLVSAGVVIAALISGLPVWAQPGDSGDRQFGGPLGGFSSGFGPSGEPVVSVAGQFTAPAAEAPARLFITATIRPGWHIYSITQAAGGPIATAIKLAPSEAYRLAGDFQAVPPPEKKREAVFPGLVVETHEERVTWHAPIELAPGINPATLEIEGAIRAQPCDASSCLPPQDFRFTAPLGPGLRFVEQPPSDAATGFDPNALVVAESAGIERVSLPAAMVFGFLGGLILNLMPCVLPVIGLKILSFVEQAGHSRRQALVLNIWYSVGLIAVFLVLASLAVFVGLGWGQLFSFKGFNITLAAVVFVMGLSFLGVWEMPIPGFAGGQTATEWAAKEGVAGAFAKGILTTVLATPCSAPFLAPALAWAVAQPALMTYSVFTAAGLGMASPYLLVGVFPELIRFLPKPGAWMDTFKQVMGFVLLATVVYIFTFIPWPYVVPTIGLLFGLWAACWWIGRTPATAGFGARACAWLGAMLMGLVAWGLMFSGTDQIATGPYASVSFRGLSEVMADRFERSVEQGIADRMAALGTSADSPGSPNRTAANPGSGPSHGLPWQPFSRAALEASLAARKTVLVDFTADWCLTCKTLEANVLNTAAVRALVDGNGVVALHADWTHGDKEVTEMLELLGSKQVPVLAIFPAGDPNRPIVFRGWYTQKALVEALAKAGPSGDVQTGAPARPTG